MSRPTLGYAGPNNSSRSPAASVYHSHGRTPSPIPTSRMPNSVTSRLNSASPKTPTHTAQRKPVTATDSIRGGVSRSRDDPPVARDMSGSSESSGFKDGNHAAATLSQRLYSSFSRMYSGFQWSSPPRDDDQDSDFGTRIELHKKKHGSKSPTASRTRDIANTSSSFLPSVRPPDDLELWTTLILPNWEEMRHSSLTLHEWTKGVPPKVRGEAWSKAVGNDLAVDSETYSSCKLRASKTLRAKKVADWRAKIAAGTIDMRRCSIASSVVAEAECNRKSADFTLLGREDTVDLVSNDISRTFPQLGIFQDDGPMAQQFTAVLQAFACYRSDIGYVQGMSYLAAMLLLNMDEESAFIAMCNMFKEPNSVLSAFYNVDVDRIQAYYGMFWSMLGQKAPDLKNHMEEVGVKPDFFLYEWILSLFSKPLHIDLAHRVWDIYFLQGDIVLFKIALSLLQFYETRLCGLGFEECITDVLRLPAKIVARNEEEAFWSYYHGNDAFDSQFFRKMLAQFGLRDIPQT